MFVRGKKLTVPDTSGDMAVDATQLDSESGGIPDYVSFMAQSDSPTVYMMFSTIAVSAQDVIDNGIELIPGVPISLQVTSQSNAQPDPAQYWFATKNGTGEGDVRVIS